MSQQDRTRWDAAYADRATLPRPALPEVFAGHESLFPRTGSALDIACGTGASAVWLAQRGLDVLGFDISAVAIARARALAERAGVAVRFEAVDLDDGLPSGAPVNLVLCHRFRDSRLDGAIIDRLTPGGLLAICVLSEVGAEPGRFRAGPGELRTAFGALQELAGGEGDGRAWLLARKPDDS